MTAQPAQLGPQIEALAGRMRAASCQKEAAWLLTLHWNPDLCGTTEGRATLYHASEMAHELGFHAVASWIAEFLEEGD